MLVTEKLTHLLPQIQDNPNGLNISDHTKVTIKCSCGKETVSSTKSLYRRWKNRQYKCKSCDVKTYSSNPERIEKFRKSFAITASSSEVKAKLSMAGKSAWNANRKQQASETLRERNKTDKRIIEGRKKALKVFMETIGHEHLAKIREEGGRKSAENIKDNPELKKKLFNNFKLDLPETRKKISIATTKTSKAKWKDPKYREAMKELQNTPEYKENAREKSVKLWQDDEYRARQLAIRSTPEYKARQSLISREVNARTSVKLAKARALANQSSISNLETTFASILDDLKIPYHQQYRIAYYTFDFYLPDVDTLIEINGDWFHRLPEVQSKDNAKATFVQRYTNKKLKTIWEHEFTSSARVRHIVDNIYHPVTQIENFDFQDVSMGHTDNIDDIRLLLSKYHYLGKCGRQSINIEFRLNNALIACMIYASPTRIETAYRLGLNKNQILELTRLCINPQYQKKNFASWMISKSIRLIKELRPLVTTLVSFADETFGHSGTIYKASNWIYDGQTEPSYFYYDNDGFVIHKKTLYNEAVKMHMKEAAFAEKYNYNKVRTSPKNRYIFKINK